LVQPRSARLGNLADAPPSGVPAQVVRPYILVEQEHVIDATAFQFGRRRTAESNGARFFTLFRRCGQLL
jgi:hypothetical protein